MKVWKILAVIGGVILLLAIMVVSTFVGRRNQMVTMREAIRQTFSQMDVVMQRRSDLVPNLVATVKGIAAQEKEVFSNIAAARAAMAGASSPQGRMAANDRLSGALGRLLVVVENYPQLRSNENFLRLQDELAGTENRIAVERRRYNQTVQGYNTYIQLFPNNMIASMTGFGQEEGYFEAAEGAREVPQVQFTQ
jgi:LemA protein